MRAALVAGEVDHDVLATTEGAATEMAVEETEMVVEETEEEAMDMEGAATEGVGTEMEETEMACEEEGRVGCGER